MTTQEENKEKRTPDYIITLRENGHRVGVAYRHKIGNGIDVVIDDICFLIDGKLRAVPFRK